MPLRGSDGGKATSEPWPTLDLQLNLLVQDLSGYQNLCRLLTQSHANLPKGESVLEPEWLEQLNTGLVAVVAVQLIDESQQDSVRYWQDTIAETFGDRVCLGLVRRLDGLDGQREQAAEDWHERYGWPIVASAGPALHHRDRKSLLDVLTCIRQGTSLDRAGTQLAANREARLRSDLEMRRLFYDHLDWVDATTDVADSLRFSLSELQYQFPCSLEPGETPDSKLARLTWIGAGRRYPQGVSSKVETQLQRELVIIAELEAAP